MKRILTITLTLLVAALGYTTENPTSHLIQGNPQDHVPSYVISDLNYGGKTGKVAPRIEKTPQAPLRVEKVEKTVQAPAPISVIYEQTPIPAEKILVAEEVLSVRQSHIYLRMNVMEPNPGSRRPPIPGLGAGYRRTVGKSAIDISAGYSKGRSGSHHPKSELITLPKIGYLFYFSPIQAQSFYVGPAFALGRIRSTAGNRFEGLIAGASVGYEMSRRSNMLSFFQLDVSLPAIPSKLTGKMPGVIAEFAFGAGF